MARQAASQATDTFKTATGNATNYGDAAQNISGTILPFLNQRLNTPQGYSQGDMGAMLANALGGAGGATSAITGQANNEAGRSRNDAGFSTALAEAARARTSSAAHSAEGVAADNAGVKLQQQDSAAKMLQGLYGTDVGAQGEALNTANQATQTGIEAGKSGWLQNAQGILSTLASLRKRP